MDARRSRQYRRVAQACENCRRKKIRCLGERPRCSACTRLRQQCSFAENVCMDEQNVSGIEDRMAYRLVQLEDKLDSIMNKLPPQSVEQPTLSSASDMNPGMTSDSPAVTHNSPLCAEPLPVEIITRAIQVYFQHVHRQPLWLFDQDSLPGPETCEELICVILALSLSYNAMDFIDANMRSPKFYSDTARRLIMLKIADESMSLQSAQALCLLTFFDLISGDIALASLYLALTKNVMQHLVLQQRTPSGSGTSQERSKLFWSVHFLNAHYGPPELVPSIPSDMSDPCYSITETRQSLTACPPVPREPSISRTHTLLEIWSQSLKICNLWGDVRLYVSRCMEGLAKCPWRPDSSYTALCSKLLDMEAIYPTSLSYNSVNLSSRLTEEVHQNRLDWLPWFRVQVTYHAIHCVLNHPFLYSVMAESSRQKLRANSFWRGSYEKALRHCTWISRLIRMANEKELPLADPFFTQAAAIAATLHLYWTRSSDTQLQASSLENLGICRSLITTMARRWPACRIVEQALDEFVYLVDPSTGVSDPQSTLTASKTSLIWTLLDVAAPQFPNFSRDSTSGRNGWGNVDGSNELTVLSLSETNTPPMDMRESTAHYASPPPWFMAKTTRTGSPAETGAVLVATEGSEHAVMPGQREATGDSAWGAWDHLVVTGESTMMDLNWWDSNNF